MTACDFFWGSHGCALDPGDGHRVHVCSEPEYIEVDGDWVKTDGVDYCCRYDEDRPAEARVSWWDPDDGGWGEWREYGEGWRQ